MAAGGPHWLQASVAFNDGELLAPGVLTLKDGKGRVVGTGTMSWPGFCDVLRSGPSELEFTLAT